MIRPPEECHHREVAGPGRVGCGLARRILGPSATRSPAASAEACRECCRHPIPSTTWFNPVVASLVYRSALAIEDDPGSGWLEQLEAARSRRYAAARLQALGTAAPPAPSPGPIRLATGMITAPRPVPTIARALRSLAEAGFGPVHIFAEPGSPIPEEFADWPRTVHGRTLGNLGNFYVALAALLMAEPEADGYALFQDDVVVARGLRAWCEGQLWPEGCGLVSLYTCGVDHQGSPGWRVRSKGREHTFGALAFLFRRDVLKEFLADGRMLTMREEGVRTGDDAAVGEWAARRGIGIAQHTPSLVDHIGETSSVAADSHGLAGPLSRTRAARSVAEVAGWRRPEPSMGKVGLIGWNTASGLGYLNRDLAARLPIDRWIAPQHPRFASLDPPPGSARIDRCLLELDHPGIRDRLRGLDWVLFAELPYFPRGAHCARDLGIRVACVPMWEFADPGADWLRVVDLMICPNRFCFELLAGWKERFGFGWDLVHVPWPIDLARFEFRPRGRCDRLLFVNGTGGCRPRGVHGGLVDYRRKGLEVLLDAARMIPSVPFLVYSQDDDLPTAPANVEIRRPPADNARLFDEGDVCVQPSHWEGLGLPLLECQAAGVPLVTTDAPPMNEYQPFRAVPARTWEPVSVLGDHVFASHRVHPEDLAEVLGSLHGADIAEASRKARGFVEAHHSWEKALPALIRALAR